MEDYARTALMGMLTATVTGPDLAEVLGSVAGRGPVIDALIDGPCEGAADAWRLQGYNATE